MNGALTRGMAATIDDLLDNLAKKETGEEVLLLAHRDGLSGKDNLVLDP